VNDLARYLELIVEPTFEDFKKNRSSVRHAFLACVVIYHASDRITYPKKPGNLLEDWREKSGEFNLVETVALHFKHVKSTDEKRRLPPEMPPETLRISHALGLSDADDQMDLHNLFFAVQDALKFVREQAKHATKHSAPALDPAFAGSLQPKSPRRRKRQTEPKALRG
jgi:hypothetical protein